MELVQDIVALVLACITVLSLVGVFCFIWIYLAKTDKEYKTKVIKVLSKVEIMLDNKNKDL